MQLKPIESRILRRDLSAVRGLIKKGLITGAGLLTTAGEQWIAQDDARIRKARAAGGIKGKKYGVQGGRPPEKKRRKGK